MSTLRNSNDIERPQHARVPKQTLYTCKVTFLKVDDVPVADLNDLSCDPYLQVTLSEDPPRDPSHPQLLKYRTRTCRRTLNPQFNEHWIVGGIPESGFLLSLELRDEDPGNYDDDLGKTVLRIPNEGEGKLVEGWKSGDREYKVHKRSGRIKTTLFTWVARTLTRGNIGHHVRLWIKVEVLGRSENQEDTRFYTVGPHRYTRHFSPLIGWLMGSSHSPDNGDRLPGSRVKPTAFVANRIQLAGPVPAALRHRYVNFAPFVKAMFSRSGIRGVLLHHALHKQHLEIYKWDKNVVWGVIDEDGGDVQKPGDEERQRGKGREEHTASTKDTIRNGGAAQSNISSHPDEPAAANHVQSKEERCELPSDSIALARQFLRMTSFGTHGRIFTYVIMLDGEWRFTETGEQLAIKFLSKHTMHSDVAIEIAYSGEFFVRPLRRHKHQAPRSSDERHAAESDHGEAEDANDGTHDEVGLDEDHPPDDPAIYELVIDNDSGTYRPRADLLPTLHSYLSRNLGALGKITCIQAFDDRLKRWKEKRKELKKRESKKAAKLATRSSLGSSATSSVSSLDSADASDRVQDVTVGDVQMAVEESARGRDTDRQVRDEKEQVTDNGPVTKQQ
ncbi:hypothetical protein BDY19DRAFT_951999 [Irpex rosettiformis]|uniref:Uncharacterized protein n=1 Tax=Irpex rosettiformis TaxID=378272 RepID=A0ACB8U1E6_9APHY|nr:hypothetical protein BDY19DRAFT_951999 [Irpex rosettiformis]